MQTIISKQNPEVKFIRYLHTSRGRKKEKKFVIEGIKIIEEVLENNQEIKKVFYSSSFIKAPKGKKLLSKVILKKISLQELSDNIFDYISSLKTHQGILAVIEEKKHQLEDIPLDKKCLILILDRIQDPGNLGTIIRLADAVDIGAVILTNNCCDIYHPKVLRAATSSIFHLPIVETELEKVADYLKKNKIKTILATPRGNYNYLNYSFTLPVALVLGNEGCGISKKFDEITDISVQIPIYGKAESLNVAVCAGILLYEIIKQVRD